MVFLLMLFTYKSYTRKEYKFPILAISLSLDFSSDPYLPFPLFLSLSLSLPFLTLFTQRETLQPGVSTAKFST